MTQLIVALDVPPGFEARLMIRALQGAGVRWFKLGVPALLSPEGLRTLEFVRHCGCEILLDLKLYDTRDTVLRTMNEVSRLGVSMVTVHQDCVEHAVGLGPRVLAVNRLTDGNGQCRSKEYLLDHVLPFSDGLVCSPWQAHGLRPLTSKLLVCPGVRPLGSPGDNHTIPATPGDAVRFGVDFVVVGRPVVSSPNPVAAAVAVMRELQLPVGNCS